MRAVEAGTSPVQEAVFSQPASLAPLSALPGSWGCRVRAGRGGCGARAAVGEEEVAGPEAWSVPTHLVCLQKCTGTGLILASLLIAPIKEPLDLGKGQLPADKISVTWKLPE